MPGIMTKKPRVLLIYGSVTDDSDKLRYPAGADAVEYMANRSKMDDATFIGGLKQAIGLTK